MLLSRLRRVSKAGRSVPAGKGVPEGAAGLECQVLDPVGLPMQAEVSLIDEGRTVIQGSSGPYGLYTAVVPPGVYQVVVSADGYQPHRAPVHIAPRGVSIGTVQLDVAPQPPRPTPGCWYIDPAHSSVRFVARHIGLAEVHGRFNRFQGALEVGKSMQDSRLDVVIEADSIDTGVRMRDDHLRSQDFLDVEEYPHLTFTSDRLVHRGGTHWLVTGVLELHGVSRTVELEATYLGLGSGMEGETRVACQARAELHREDFTLSWQKLLARGIAVMGTTIRIELDIQLTQFTPSHV